MLDKIMKLRRRNVNYKGMGIRYGSTDLQIDEDKFNILNFVARVTLVNT